MGWLSGVLICSVFVMMNKQTRKLSKIPPEVREEIEPYFMDSAPIVDEDMRKLPKLDDRTADFVRSGLSVSQSSFRSSVANFVS